MVMSEKRRLTGGPGNPGRVLTVMGCERGPSPAGLNAKIWILYSVYLSRKTRLCEVIVAAITSISSSNLWPASKSWGESVTK